MNNARLVSLAFVLSSVAGAAFAQAPLTRAQVKVELAQAIRNGNVEVGDTGRTLAELEPSRFPHPVQAPALTRAQVKAELAQAEHDGTLPVGDIGLTMAELEPSRYPHPVQAPGLTRAEVKAELARATRDGDIEQGESSETLAEQFPERYAAVRARDGERQYALN